VATDSRNPVRPRLAGSSQTARLRWDGRVGLAFPL
jgi:hypothetical protein